MLESLFRPHSIAVIGASRSSGKVGHDILANLINGGFQGTIIPVNPSAGEILGLSCLENLKSFKEKIDLSIIAVPKPHVKDAVKDSIQAGAGAIILITAGFKETGSEGAELEKEIAATCKAHNVRLLGPNCLGLINTDHQMNASFAGKMPLKGTISVLSSPELFQPPFLI